MNARRWYEPVSVLKGLKTKTSKRSAPGKTNKTTQSSARADGLDYMNRTEACL
ncbi:hypothetical protein [Streptomyces sp. NPDC018321]|uniref:hypothetical protein n=1 Tax=unclassified Streptomyces TaxID=2593676 RepID=UPI0037B9BC0B